MAATSTSVMVFQRGLVGFRSVCITSLGRNCCSWEYDSFLETVSFLKISMRNQDWQNMS